MSAIFLLVGILSSIGLEFTAAQSIGVCYGMNGDSLPSRQDVVDLYKSKGIRRMRIYSPDEQALQALKGSNIELILDVPKDKLLELTDANAATDWVNKNVAPYSQNVKYIAVGNEIEPNDNEARSVLPAMQNIKNAISTANLQGQIKVSTAIKFDLIGKSYPPNDGVFSDQAGPYIQPIINILKENGAPLLANVYPYFAYAVPNQQSITLDYALFNQQGNNGGYQNLFDAMLDSIYAALEKVGASDVQVVVSESGWPSAGGKGATVENAGAYYAKLIDHVKSGNGTPKRPSVAIETYLFAMFDENLKSGEESEKHFGLFSPDKSPKYTLSFN